MFVATTLARDPRQRIARKPLASLRRYGGALARGLLPHHPRPDIDHLAT